MNQAIYVACGTGGLLKAGRTSNIKARVQMLKREFRVRGDTLKEVVNCGEVRHWYLAEKDLLALLGTRLDRHSGSEWFYGREFANAVRAGREIVAWTNERFGKGWRPATVTEFVARKHAEWGLRRHTTPGALDATQPA